MKQLVAYQYPNRETRISLTRIPSTVVNVFLSGEDEVAIAPKVSTPPLDHRSKLHENAESPISPLPVEPELKPGYGGLPRWRKFSLYGKRQLRRCGGVIDMKDEYQSYQFITCTIPGSTPESFEAVARWSAWLTDRMLKWCRYQCKSDEYMYCWEWQKRGALHWHCVIKHDDKSDDNALANAVKKQWTKLLDGVCERSGIDVWRKNRRFTHARDKSKLQTKVVRCERSVAGYLSKYLGKASSGSQSSRAGVFCPSRWYGICRLLLSQLRDCTQTRKASYLSDRKACQLYELAHEALTRWADVFYEYRNKVGDGINTVAYHSKQEVSSVWNQLMNILPFQANSSSIGGEVYRHALREGFCLMTRNWHWQQSYSQNSYPYVRTVESKWEQSQPMTSLEMIALLDYLSFSLHWAAQTRMSLTPMEASWLCRVKEITTS